MQTMRISDTANYWGTSTAIVQKVTESLNERSLSELLAMPNEERND